MIVVLITKVIFFVILLFEHYEINQHLAESKGPNAVVVFT